jgi:imidazolonepropionase-like amidohydrolase
MTVPIRPLAFVGARLVDGRSPDAVKSGSLVIDEQGRIMAAGAGRAISFDRDVETVDLTGLTLLPGIIDCHVHLAMKLEPVHDEVQHSATDIVVRCLDSGRKFLEAGVTTIRDAGYAPAGIKRAFASGTFPGPRAQMSCQPLSQTGGHADDWMPSGMILKTELSDLPNGVADGPDEVRKATRLQIRAGADWIKVMATGGVTSATDYPDASQFTIEEIRAIVEEAGAAGIKGTMAHAEGTAGIKNALRAGISSIEHGDLVDDEGIDLMLERDVPLIPTFNINFALMSEERIARGEVKPWAVDKMRYLFEHQQANFLHAVERGVRVCMGTDSFNGMYPPAELAYMAEFGLGPFRAIQAATTEAAKLLGLADEVGTLEPGRIADLIAVSGDPLAEPALWHDPARIVLVVQGGRIVADRRGA